MAWGRKKSGGRKEPRFGLAASLAELRLSPQDRVTVGDEDDEDETPKKPSAKRKARDADDDAPRERKPRPTPVSRARKSKTRSPIGISRLFYWAAVVGLWAAIAVVGVIIWVGAHLPTIQSLEIPKRPPTIQITGFDGSVLATRGELAGANVALKDLPPYLPKAFIAIEDRRFYSHYGVDPVGIARGGRQYPASRGFAGRLDADPAARQESVSDAGAHPATEIAGGRTRVLAGAQAFQVGDSRTLPQPGIFRLRRLWRRSGRAALFREIRQERHDRGSRDARGAG